jgi:hypothetical protein
MTSNSAVEKAGLASRSFVDATSLTDETMKRAPDIAGGLLGLTFLIFSLNYFFPFLPASPPPPGKTAAAFAYAMRESGYLVFVKILEILGGILVAIPKYRNFGLLILGPIIVNILLFNAYIAEGTAVLQPPVILISLLALFLLWSERKAFAALVHRGADAPVPESEKPTD